MAAFTPRDEDAFKEYMNKQLGTIKEERLRPESERWRSDDTSQPNFEETCYAFDNPHRGLAVIFSNEKFMQDPKSKLAPVENLTDYAKDVLALRQSFNNLEFDVLEFCDLTASQTERAAQRVAERYRHEESDCFVCVLLSHGYEKKLDKKPDGNEKEDASKPDGNEKDDSSGKDDFHHLLLGSDGKDIVVKDVIETFNDTKCGSLRNKPRLFFIQSCRGGKDDKGVNIGEVREPGLMETITMKLKGLFIEKKKLKIRPIPLYQDCLIMYAAPPGYIAALHIDGSWFVNALTDFLLDEKVGTVSFLRGLTSVNDTMATKYPRGNCADVEWKQMSVIDSMLIKDIIMSPK